LDFKIPVCLVKKRIFTNKMENKESVTFEFIKLGIRR